MRKSEKIFKFAKIAACFFILASAIFLLSNFVLAADVDTGIDYAAGTGLSNDQDIRVTIAKIIRIVIGFLGIIAVSLIMYAGWVWMTSEGNEEKIEQAKKILTNAVIGLAIILSAFAIVSFIINVLGGSGGGNKNNADTKNSQSSFSMSAYENGAIQSVYPARGQQDVPRNTSIMITFKQAIKPESLISGGKVNAASVEIRKSGDDRLITEDVNFAASTQDNETFVFTPDAYLGSPSEKISYIINLNLKNITKLDDGKAISNPWSQWNFEISDIIDLTPPQVKSGGVFPIPDNAEDTVESLSAANQATGKIEIKSKPNIYSAAQVTSVTKTGDWSEATATVDGDCEQNGGLKVNYTGGAIRLSDSSDRLLGQGSISGRIASFDVCNLKLTLSEDGASFNEGNLWTVNVRAMASADTITIGSTVYTAGAANDALTFKSENNNSATAINLAQVLAGNSDVSATANGAAINLVARTTGESGNEINLTSSNQNRIAITAMSGGSDKEENVTVKDKADVARNAVIRIDFNEAVNPLTVAGKSSDVSNYIQVINLSDGNKIVPGNFKISNQYKTVEFISNDECGVNSCGEKVYCLPENARLQVVFKAASLADCGSDNCASRSPYSTCSSGRCQDSNSNNYPLAKISSLDGVVDLAANSLDGNRNNNAQGPVSYFNENSGDITSGDNFAWSFFTSDKIDLTGPRIAATKQADKDGNEQEANNGVNMQLYQPLVIYFNKIMMSSSLRTGETTVNNGEENITHKLINLWNFSNKSLGYWVVNENIDSSAPLDGAPDATKAYIYHSGLAETTAYRAQVGSGVRDIYQNCYKPSQGVGCAGGVDENNPSCCSGTATANLGGDGNCQ